MFHLEAPTAPMTRRALAVCAATIFSLCLSTGTLAQPQVKPKVGGEIRIAFSYEPSSLDPHFATIAGNNAVAAHFFDRLVHVDDSGKFVPGLATAWRAVDSTTWEFTLRRGVKFSDGSDFTAEDVAFSLDRPARVVNSPGPFTSYTKAITQVQVVDAYTVRLQTAQPYGPLPDDLSSIYIVSKKAAANAVTEDFNSGKALIGTGPFVLTTYRRGEIVTMSRNPLYWGDKPAWEKVSIRFITADATRVAALLAGDVDLIEGVPTADLPRLQADAKLQVQQHATWRTLFLHLNHAAADSSPVFNNKAGQPLGKNPLKDIRVREALSKGLDRQALVKAAVDGLATPAGQVVAPGILGFNPALKVEPADIEGAKKLLAQAGYPNGFGITLAVPNNRYVNDEQIGQAIGQLWSRIGVQVKLEAAPFSVYLPKMKRGEFGAAMLGWGTLGSDIGLRPLLGTPDDAKGWGTWNWGRYTNPRLDELVQSALSSTDRAKREENAQAAMALAVKDYALLPTHHQLASWAMRKGFAYTGRLDEYTFAHQVKAQ